MQTNQAENLTERGMEMDNLLLDYGLKIKNVVYSIHRLVSKTGKEGNVKTNKPSVRDIAIFLMQNDSSLLSEEIISRNGHDMYEGNLRLNKYLHIANNVYIAKYGDLLFPEPIYAYDNGGVVLDVYPFFLPLKNNLSKEIALPEDIEQFLLQIINSLRNATSDELVDISHQDEEWESKQRSGNQRMDPLARVEEYKEQYRDILKILELGLC